MEASGEGEMMMMKKVSLRMVIIGFIVLAAVPGMAIGLSMGPSFQNMAPGDMMSAKLMMGDLWGGVFRDFDGGGAHDHFIPRISDPDLSTRAFFWTDTSDNSFSGMPHFRLNDGGFSHLGFGYPTVSGGYGFPFIYGETTYKDISPVPEPAAMVLLGTGLMGLSVLMRKKIIKL